jgi:hypothetical protein
VIDLITLSMAVIFTTASTLVFALLLGVFATWLARKIHGSDEPSAVTDLFNIDFDSEELLRRFISDVEIADLFRYHPAESEEVRDAHAQIRSACLALAQELQEILPESPQKTMAIRQYLVNVMNMANQAIALHGLPISDTLDEKDAA